MTKYSKIKKSSFAILALSLILVAVLAFGGTYAYFNAKVEGGVAGSVTTGNMSFDVGESVSLTTEETSLVPNQTVALSGLSDVSFEGNVVSALRMKITTGTVTGGTAPTDLATNLVISVSKPTGGSGAAWSDVQADGYVYYLVTVEGGASGLDLSTIADISVELKAAAGNNYQGLTIPFTVTIEAAQAEYVIDGMTTAGTAITAAQAATLIWANA